MWTSFIKRLKQPRPHRLAAQARAGNKPVRIVVGSSNVGPEGWILTNATDLDIRDRSMWELYGPPGSIDSLFAEHVLEHLTIDDAQRAVRNSVIFLKPGGRFRVAVPDGYHPDPGYIEQVRVGGSGPGAKDHKVLYTYKTIAGLFREAGFEIQFLEYFDENGQFHAVDWTDEAGRVIRSRRYDPRNSFEKLVYTSLIIDAVRPSPKTS